MIRTCDLLIRSQALYPAELRVQSEQLDYREALTDVKFTTLPSKISGTRSRNEIWIVGTDLYLAPFAVVLFVCRLILDRI